jgi:probable HAF family extracellular repeat protein
MFRRYAIILGVLCVVFGNVGFVFAALSFTVTDLGTLDGTDSSTAADINNYGQVVGTCWNGKAEGVPGVNHAFRYSGSMTDLGTLGGADSVATGINDNGQVVGHSRNATRSYRAFRYSGSLMTDLGTLGGWSSSAASINNSGHVVGQAETTPGVIGACNAFRYNNSPMTDLGLFGGVTSDATGINDDGQIIANSLPSNYLTGFPSPYGHPSSSSRAFLCSGSNTIDLGALSSSPCSYATGINNSGQVVGYATTSDNAHAHAFFYNGSSMIDLGVLPGSALSDYSCALDVNSAGQIVGYSYRADPTSPVFPSLFGNPYKHAFVFDGSTMIDLNDLIDASLGITLTSANGINDLGQIVGECYDVSTDSTRAFLLTPAPEPSSLALFTIGATSLFGYAWRRRQGRRKRVGSRFLQEQEGKREKGIRLSCDFHCGSADKIG